MLVSVPGSSSGSAGVTSTDNCVPGEEQAGLIERWQRPGAAVLQEHLAGIIQAGRAAGNINLDIQVGNMLFENGDF
jgi:hypothetical protein